MSHEGYLRHLLVRRAQTTGDILVNLVTSSQAEHDFTELVEELLKLELEGHITGILHIINDSLADVVQSDETRILYGKDYFYETILGLKFKITPFSFFQTNSLGAEVLYSAARNYIGSTKDILPIPPVPSAPHRCTPHCGPSPRQSRQRYLSNAELKFRNVFLNYLLSFLPGQPPYPAILPDGCLQKLPGNVYDK